MTDYGIEIIHDINSGPVEFRSARQKRDANAFDTICNNFLRSRDATNN